VATEFGLPVANAVLTTNTDEQAVVRAPVKGAEAARVAVEMARLGDWLDEFDPVDGIDWLSPDGERD
jgi:6,7-dimethyl-8-ribityllumazine synthase